MAIRSGGRAPYAPTAAVLAVIRAFRDRGLTTPFTQEVLLRAGISESLVPRTLNAMEDLELIDKDGNPTAALEALRRATTDEFKTRMEEVIRSVYAEVFQFTDPAKDDTTRVTDAFRSYQPVGQRDRMVSLFLGLCMAAGIVPEGTVKKTPPTNGQYKATKFVRRPPATREAESPPQQLHVMKSGAIPAPIQGILAKLPPEGTGWTLAERARFLAVFTTNLDFVFPTTDGPVPTAAAAAF